MKRIVQIFDRRGPYARPSIYTGPADVEQVNTFARRRTIQPAGSRYFARRGIIVVERMKFSGSRTLLFENVRCYLRKLEIDHDGDGAALALVGCDGSVISECRITGYGRGTGVRCQ